MSVSENVLLICPTLNPGTGFEQWSAAIRTQKQPMDVLIVDSSSDDGTDRRALDYGFRLKQIPRSDFSHGGTRSIAIEENEGYDFYIFVTQDALPADALSLQRLLKPFDDPRVAAVYGRQLPRFGAGAIETHARMFNYPAESHVRSLDDVARYGIKTAFLSNSCAAYRREALTGVGLFPADVIFGEDMYVAARLLQAGKRIAYAGDACVYHSHNYSLAQEMKRYFDMGVFHAREPWIRQEFGTAEREGLGFVLSEFNYLLRHAFWRIPEGMLRTALRYTGFRLGRIEKHIPLNIKKIISLNSGYFK